MWESSNMVLNQRLVGSRAWRPDRQQRFAQPAYKCVQWRDRKRQFLKLKPFRLMDWFQHRNLNLSHLALKRFSRGKRKIRNIALPHKTNQTKTCYSIQWKPFSATVTVGEQVSLQQPPSLVQMQPWQSAPSRKERGGSVFLAFIFRLSLEGGSMDFKQLRFCKRIALEDKRSLWRLSAGRREAAARNCKAGLSANSQTKSIEFSCL